MAKTTYKQTIKGSKDNSKSFERQADLLKKLVEARKDGKDNLDAQLANANRRNAETRKSVVADLVLGQQAASAGYDRSEKDNDANLGISAASSMLNRAREGTSAMAELSNMQAGETDRIKAMAASLRGMKANMDGGVSDYANAITSLNNSIGDMNTSVRTNINNALRDENTQNATAFGEYTSGRQQAYADIVDLYGQQGSAYEGMADALKTKTSTSRSSGTKNVVSTQSDSVSYGKLGKAAVSDAQKAFDRSANASQKLADEMGKTFTEGIKTIDQMNGELDPSMRYADVAMKQNNSNLDDLENRGTLRKMAAPEGATLRKKVPA